MNLGWTLTENLAADLAARCQLFGLHNQDDLEVGWLEALTRAAEGNPWIPDTT